MNWTQVFDPLDNIALSAIVAALPILFIFWALIIKKMKGYMASMLTAGLAVLIAIFVFKMPAKLALLSTAHGALYGLFPICWIIITAVFLYNISVKSGQFEIIKNFMATITSDRRLQALLIAFSFGAFLEGVAGMGTPVAITAAMLVGLGFNPLYAAGICLIANTAPVAFGGIGIPIAVASQVSGIPEMAISQMIGRTLPFLSVLVPFYLVVLMSGFRKSLEVFPAILVTGITFAFLQWFSSNYMSPMLPDVIAGLGSIVALIILLKFWKPKSIWRFKEEPPQIMPAGITYTTGQIVKAWSPFIILTVIIIAWGLQPVKDILNTTFLIKFDIPGLHNRIINGDVLNSPIPQTFKFNYLSATGTAILISVLISIGIFGMKLKECLGILVSTVKQLTYPLITIMSVLGFAYIANNSGMSITMAKALTNTGFLFPFFAPVLGWLGVFLTGSDTSSNALFGKLQYSTADALNIDPVITVSANASGGVTGKMISPQSIAVGAASVGLVGKESDLFRFTVKHSFIFLSLICVLTILQAYVIKWIVPVYQMLENQITTAKPDTTRGTLYLLILILVLAAITFFVIQVNRKSKKVKYTVRNADPSEFAEVGRLMVQVYSQLEGFPDKSEQPDYYNMLANIGDLTTRPETELLVAVSEAGKIAGGVVFFGDVKYYGSGGTATHEKDAAGFRLLAVDQSARGQGVGKLLTTECINKARNKKTGQVIIHTTQAMQTAWKMYENLGFKRSEDLDFIQGQLPVFGFRLFL